MNKNLLIIIVIIAVIFVGGFMFMSNQPSPAPTDEVISEPTSSDTPPAAAENNGARVVEIKNFAFNPPTITIKAGESITWINKDSVGHSAVSDASGFDTGILAQNASRTLSFDTAGTQTYHCGPHPNMKATVIVE